MQTIKQTRISQHTWRGQQSQQRILNPSLSHIGAHTDCAPNAQPRSHVSPRAGQRRARKCAAGPPQRMGGRNIHRNGITGTGAQHRSGTVRAGGLVGRASKDQAKARALTFQHQFESHSVFGCISRTSTYMFFNKE
ncbi:hypothetical protein T440DRAFT_96169 [Plenodomus tracheiphilus IPT5]|uniref:Uncharacterized protein n=1 Tax=Plenodomus tracheiphilus IPT5 TaxID=1408161 RepID=A0A6A7BKM6_9PLEO|nr:hypothetical protein T440DRAFT_96169 [Plenodomus tracheiphilus IPT5]